jgi:hypothetical protein
LAAHLAWNKKMIVCGNDILDHEHANAALATCSYFFTEDGLSHLCSAGPVKITSKFAVQVASKADEVIAHLESL